MISSHPYIRYAQALLYEQLGLSDLSEINFGQIKQVLRECANCFSLKLSSISKGDTEVRYQYSSEKNDAKCNIYLSPHVVSTADNARHFLSNLTKALALDDDDLSKVVDITMSSVPLASEFCGFSGTISRGKPKAPKLEYYLGLITSLSKDKPCLSSFDYKTNYCLLPDIPLPDMVNFIRVFKRMQIQKMDKDLFAAKVEKDIPKRPNIFRGNFPNAPKSVDMGPIALLGSIGEMTKDAEFSELANFVLESLKNANFYICEYGRAQTSNYNSLVVELAQKGRLKEIIGALYRTQLYLGDRYIHNRNIQIEYQKFDMFSSRFLQLLSKPTFRDFLSFRGQYQSETKVLFEIYFTNMEKIDSKIVASAKELGRWLNNVSYHAAKNSVEKQDAWEKIREAKAKVLVEMESTIFSSKTGDALIAHVITRAGRLSGFDAPESSALFMEKTASGELPLEQAQNLLVAFSRLVSKSDKSVEITTDEIDMESEIEDNSDL